MAVECIGFLGRACCKWLYSAMGLLGGHVVNGCIV
jgi:hypothetical protein